jgi:hypothetical protein
LKKQMFRLSSRVLRSTDWEYCRHRSIAENLPSLSSSKQFCFDLVQDEGWMRGSHWKIRESTSQELLRTETNKWKQLNKNDLNLY